MSSPGRATSRGIHLDVVGESGPYVAFCHGLFGQGRNWMTIARGLSPRYRSILVDLPNHGQSAWTERVSITEWSAFVADALSKLTGDQAVALVGHSLGGKVAMVIALSQTHLVERLCIVDVAPRRYAGRNAFGSYVEGMQSLDPDHLKSRAEADRRLQPYVADETIRAFLLQNLRRDGSTWRWQMNLDLLGEGLEQLSDWPRLDVAPFGGPVLWVAGAMSDYIRPEYAPTMRALFPRVRQVTIKNAGHWVHSERPDVFLAVLREFLER